MAEPGATLEAVGWVHLGPILSADLLTALRTDAARLLNDDTRLIEVWPHPETQAASFAALLEHAGLRATVARLLGSPSARVVEQSLIARGPHHRRHIPWHQDQPTWPPEHAAGVTVWLALDDVGPSSGGLRYIPGSHRDPTTPDSPVSVTVDAGCGVAHHGLMWHATGPNRTDNWRRACVLTVIPSEAPER